MVRFSNIVKSFDSITALKGINLEFLTFQTSVLIGPRITLLSSARREFSQILILYYYFNINTLNNYVLILV